MSMHKFSSSSCGRCFYAKNTRSFKNDPCENKKRTNRSSIHTQKKPQNRTREKNRTNGARRGNRARPWLRLRRTSVVTPVHRVTKPPRGFILVISITTLIRTHTHTPIDILLSYDVQCEEGFRAKTRVFRDRGAQLCRRFGCHDRQRDDVTSGRHFSYDDVARSRRFGNVDVAEFFGGNRRGKRAGDVRWRCARWDVFKCGFIVFVIGLVLEYRVR